MQLRLKAFMRAPNKPVEKGTWSRRGYSAACIEARTGPDLNIPEWTCTGCALLAHCASEAGEVQHSCFLVPNRRLYIYRQAIQEVSIPSLVGHSTPASVA